MEVKIAQKGLLSRTEAKVLMKADHAFGNFTQRINALDKIWFKGILRTSLSSRSADYVVQKPQDSDDTQRRRHTRVELTAIGCLQCSDGNLESISIKGKLKIENRLKDLRRALKYLLNVLFNPLVTFK